MEKANVLNTLLAATVLTGGSGGLNLSRIGHPHNARHGKLSLTDRLRAATTIGEAADLFDELRLNASAKVVRKAAAAFELRWGSKAAK